MKKLLLIRHAKASHETGYTNDFERPLTPSGIKDAGIMAQRLHSKGVIPQVLISSPALRTLSTANVLAEHLSLPAPILVNEIFDAGTKALFNIVENLPDEYDFIGLIGHNPAISDIIFHLTGKTENMDPGAVVFIEFEIESWKMVSEGNGEFLWYTTPKELD